MAHKRGVPLIVDNTVATPVLLRPIEYGADIVVHSLTKFMGGHGTTLGGAIVDSGRFPWKKHARRFPMFSQPDPSYHNMVYTDHYKEAAYIGRCRSVYQRTTGSVLSPLSAFLLLQGIETVALRVDRHVENGSRVAEFLRDDPRVEWVNYTGFADNVCYALARKYLGGRACPLMTFGVTGGFEAGKKFYDALDAGQASRQPGRRQVTGLPSGVHHASADVRRRTAEGRRDPGDDPAQRRHRAHRRHHRRPRSGARCDRVGQLGKERPDDHRTPVTFSASRHSSGRSAGAARRRRHSTSPIRIASTSASSTTCPTRRSTRPNGSFARCSPRRPATSAVRLTLYTLPEVPRTEFGRQQVSSYSSIDELWDRRHDGLIVTGTEPRAADLKDEPFWGSLTRVLEWAEHHTYSTILSCLAAHAGILHIDGIAQAAAGRQAVRRVRVCARLGSSADRRRAGRLPMPHSRWNEIPEDALLACGYRVLTRSEDAGVDAFVKQRKSLFVFFQGHPEYDAMTLLLEYRRDIGRFLRGERETYPPMPQGYFDDEIVACAGGAARAGAVGPPRGAARRVPDCDGGRQGDEQLASGRGRPLSQLAAVHPRGAG